MRSPHTALASSRPRRTRSLSSPTICCSTRRASRRDLSQLVCDEYAICDGSLRDHFTVFLLKCSHNVSDNNDGSGGFGSSASDVGIPRYLDFFPGGIQMKKWIAAACAVAVMVIATGS